MSVLVDHLDVFAGGLWLTFQLCLLSAIGALLLGTIGAVMRIAPIPLPPQWSARPPAWLARAATNES